MLTNTECNGGGIDAVIAKTKNAPILFGINAAMDAVKLLCFVCRWIVFSHDELLDA